MSCLYYRIHHMEEKTRPFLEGTVVYTGVLFVMNFSSDLSRDRLDRKRGIPCSIFASVPEDFVHKKSIEEIITV